jgi:transposase-like protein
MTTTLTAHCPTCEEELSFYRAASTEVHLGAKIKWRCPDCEYGFVRIGGRVDTSAA